MLQTIVWTLLFSFIEAQDTILYISPNETCDLDCTLNKREVRKHVDFYFFSSQHQDVLINEDNLHLIDPSKMTKVIVHGEYQTHNASWVLHMMEQYLEVGDYNTILPDYSYFTTLFPKEKSCCYFIPVGRTIGHFLKKLYREVGLGFDKIHVMGASLGAHFAAYAGKSVQRKYPDKKIARVTTFDAARLYFYNLGSKFKAQKNDAAVVDAIHTNNGYYGIEEDFGTVDFQINCGTFQPQCGKNIPEYKPQACSHALSHVYYVATILDPHKYTATKCNSCEYFEAGNCDSNEKIFFGEAVPSTAKGRYYVKILDVESVPLK